MEELVEELFKCFEEGTPPETEKTEQKPHRISNAKTTKPKREHNDEDEEILPKKIKIEKEDVDFADINLEEFRNRIMVHKIETVESCTHEVAYPAEQDYIPLKLAEGEPVKIYPFALDPFQKESILCVDNNQSVLVSAHTSAGKTVIAEYAIAICLKNKQRVIYTTPIKALSNQKYREFLNEFQDVGLMTGDVTINPTASCLIMTTEILRNMLYRGSEIMREIGWVVFDEIHYMRDKERGVVWEETLILLPDNCRFVFLSATIPNARQFAEWVAHLHKQPCHVVYTDYRPTPLQHYIFPAGGEGIHMVVDKNGTFREESFNAAMRVLQNVGDAAKGDEVGRKGGARDKDPTQTDIYKVIKLIMERDFGPVIVFSFSKKTCEFYAMQMTKFDFNSKDQKKLVDEVFNNAMEVLSEEDRNLPQISQILPMLRRGIGIHHGGLLPIMKEIIEILFGEGLIQVLFATETFSMGLNMPARTVLFTGVKKFDGRDFRWVTPGEYIQMSGRAGRRGIDSKGIVILMADEKLSPNTGREIVKGQPDPINSAFHLTYNMVLNLLRVEEINPEYLMERSFYQFQNQAAVPQLCDTYQARLEELNKFQIKSEEQIATYYNIKQELDAFRKCCQSYVTKPQNLVNFLQPGRLLKIKIKDDEYDWGVVTKMIKDNSARKQRKKFNESNMKIKVDLLLRVIPGEDTDDDTVIPKPCLKGQRGEIEIVTVDSKYITHLSSIRLKLPTQYSGIKIASQDRRGIQKKIEEVKRRFPNIPLLDPIRDMKITDPELVEVVKKINQLEKRLSDHPIHESDLLASEYSKYVQKANCQDELKIIRQKLLEAKSILQLDELKCRKRVLRRLGYCSISDVIELKGRVACELSSGDELLLTEMIFNGLFGSLSPAQACALLSCFVCDERDGEMSKLSEELSAPLRQLQDLARRIAKVSTDCRLLLDEEAYVDKFRPGLMDVVYSWCNGATFSELCKMTKIYEGSIVRCMRRLEELLRQMVDASKTIGNTDLESKFSTANKMIKRDIIFSASLYL